MPTEGKRFDPSPFALCDSCGVKPATRWAPDGQCWWLCDDAQCEEYERKIVDAILHRQAVIFPRHERPPVQLLTPRIPVPDMARCDACETKKATRWVTGSLFHVCDEAKCFERMEKLRDALMRGDISPDDL